MLQLPRILQLHVGTGKLQASLYTIPTRILSPPLIIQGAELTYEQYRRARTAHLYSLRVPWVFRQLVQPPLQGQTYLLQLQHRLLKALVRYLREPV
jgi:hypothetical protein